MNDSRIEWKVGIFVFVGLVAAGLLILNFSKGLLVWKSTYEVHLEMPTVAGLKPAADVMLAGVPIGKVMGTSLSLDGHSVDITLEILAKYKIRRDAKFHIDAQGFLGDQYIEVTPAENPPPDSPIAPLLTNGEVVSGDAPFNMQEAVRSISGLLDQARTTIKDIDTAVTNVNKTVLTADSLARVSKALNNFDAVSEDASVMAKDLRGVIDSNSAQVHTAVVNFVDLSQKLNDSAEQLSRLVAANTDDVSLTVKNLRDTSTSLKELADGLEAGQGVAGGLLKDEKMKQELGLMLTNISSMSEQFSLFGLRLNQNGIWRTLWKPKTPETNSPSR